MKEIKTKNELEEAIANNDIVICKWGAPWCVQCRVLEENIAKLEKENADLAEFLEVNIEEADEDFVADSGIRNIPVLQYYKNGELIDKTVGLITEAQLIDNIKYLK